MQVAYLRNHGAFSHSRYAGTHTRLIIIIMLGCLVCKKKRRNESKYEIIIYVVSKEAYNAIIEL